MKVSLRDGECNYESDFPNGWKFAAGDYYKFPVKLCNTKCFIKRFDKKPPEKISGWQLMQSLKRKRKDNLPRLFDIVATREKNRDVYYVFYEFHEGLTLEDSVSLNDETDLQKLNDALFSALAAINEYHYWFRGNN